MKYNYKAERYKKIVERLKEELIESIDEGEELGVDKDEDTYDQGRYEAYKDVLEFINNLEKLYL